MPFSITIEPSGRRFDVETGETVLAAAIRHGIGLAYSCQDGACGTCRCRIVSGEVHALDGHSGAIEPNGHARICVTLPGTDIVLESTSVAPAGMYSIQKLPCRVTEIRLPAPDVAIVRLETPRNRIFEFHPGQYVELSIRDGTTRKYSLASAHGREGIEFHIRRLPGGRFSGYVFDNLKLKETMHLNGPFGTFMLRDSGRPIVLLASGTGFAPIKAIIETIKNSNIQRDVSLYWGCRRREDLYLHDWAERSIAALSHARYVPVLSEPLPQDAWAGRTGLVHRAVVEDFQDLSGYEVYACGAPVMVNSARKDFVSECRLPLDQFFADAFIPGHGKS